jgi:nitrogen fixation/metabolism regulation signal transduction histidine kinase
MTIKTKIFCTSIGMALLVALVGMLAVNRQHVAATIGASQEAENVAHILGFLLSDSNGFSPSAQQIVSELNQAEKRDVVVVDTNQLILADSVAADIGKNFTEDPDGEVRATMMDRRARTFVEISSDSPLPMKQVVVPVQTSSGRVIGAVVLEYTQLYNELMQSTRLIRRQVIAAVIISVLMAFLIAFYIGRSIAVPLEQLTTVATGFASGRTDLPVPQERADEIGELAKAFNNMLQKRQQAEAELRQARDSLETRVLDRTQELESTHRQLLIISRQAGMAEVATSVLHNVGNVLNSVNVSATLLAEQSKKSKVTNLAKVVALLEEHTADLGEFITNDPKGKQLPGYLAQLSSHLAAEQATFLKEADQIRVNIEHIKDIVAMQQSYARVSGVTELLQVSDLVEDALRMNAGALTRHDVQVIREFEPIPLVTIDKHKVLQVLVNLIRNAKYACDESGRPDKLMTMRVSNGGDRLRISVSDNGVGIPPENLVRIFNHGFTTREEGHGFGLHSGALAAKELGGALTVHSEGRGRGASFTLELPLVLAGGNAAPVLKNS